MHSRNRHKGMRHGPDPPRRPACLLACGFALPAPSIAAIRDLCNQDTPASACQLSIPATDTEVRPKATGFFTPIDGAGRTTKCTAVSGLPRVYAPACSSKSVSSTEAVTFSARSRCPSDFGGTSNIPDSFSPSMTCVLPPQTAMTLIDNQYGLEIGS